MFPIFLLICLLFTLKQSYILKIILIFCLINNYEEDPKIQIWKTTFNINSHTENKPLVISGDSYEEDLIIRIYIFHCLSLLFFIPLVFCFMTFSYFIFEYLFAFRLYNDFFIFFNSTINI